MLGEGAAAPDFELPDLSGAIQNLQSLAADPFKQRPLVLAFYRIGCPVCQFTFPFLERISKGAIRIAGVSQDDAAGSAEFHHELGITFPSVVEQRGWKLGGAYRITSVPTLFLVESGAVTMAVSGFSKAAIESLGVRAGVAAFREGELIPAFRPG